MNVLEAFVEAYTRRKTANRSGTTLLATELTPRDIAISRLILRRINSLNAAEQLRSMSVFKVIDAWLKKNGAERAAEIVLLVKDT